MPRKKAGPQEYYVKFATADGSNGAVFVNVTGVNQIPREVRRQTLYRKIIIYSAKRVVHVKCPKCGSNSAVVTDKVNIVACALCGAEYDQNHTGEET
jgi:ribosomal protein S27E